MKFRYNRTMPEEFMSLCQRSGTRVLDRSSAVTALRNSLFMIGIYDADEVVAFGRVCGDEALYYLVCDIMVDERYHGQNLEVHILKEIDDYLRVAVTKQSQVLIHVATPYDAMCRRYGFKYLDSDYEAIMKR